MSFVEHGDDATTTTDGLVSHDVINFQTLKGCRSIILGEVVGEYWLVYDSCSGHAG